jgi:restriction system protein
MAEITKRRKGELVRGVFQVLMDEPNGLPAQDVLRRLEAIRPPTPFEQSDYAKHPGQRRFEKVVRFSTITSVKAGWLTKADGKWSLTPLGRDAYSKWSSPEAFIDEAWRLYRAWKGTQPKAPDVEETEGDEVETSVVLEEAEDSARNQIREYIEKMPPYDFQNLVAALLRAMDYFVSHVAPPGPDRGVDIIAFGDPLGTKLPRIKVQVKRQESPVPADKLRSFLSTIGETDVGIFVSTGGFTNDAQEEARHEKRHITLIHLDDLVRLWIKAFDKVAESDKELLPIRAVYFLAPS